MIRPCTEQEAVDILNSDGVTQRIGFEVTNLLRGEPHIINDRMFALFKPSGTIMEVHLGQSRKNWKYIHQDIDDGLEYLANQGYVKVITSVTAKLKTTLNLLAKHGFKETGRNDDKVFLACQL
jgi:hypothetical protein